MAKEAMLILIGVLMSIQAAVRLYTAIIEAQTAQRMAASVEDEARLAEMEILAMRDEMPEQEQPMQETRRAADEDRITAPLVRKGASRISERRAEAGF